ncbi:EamA family transporter [Micromonospora endolithica]|nr:EamA family transporter [Micromonospora endolithica]
MSSSSMPLLGVSGSLAFVEARHLTDLGVVAVLASFYPAVTVLLARMLLGERLGIGQRLGLVFCSAAVGLIAAG